MNVVKEEEEAAVGRRLGDDVGDDVDDDIIIVGDESDVSSSGQWRASPALRRSVPEVSILDDSSRAFAWKDE